MSYWNFNITSHMIWATNIIVTIWFYHRSKKNSTWHHGISLILKFWCHWIVSVIISFFWGSSKYWHWNFTIIGLMPFLYWNYNFMCVFSHYWFFILFIFLLYIYIYIYIYKISNWIDINFKLTSYLAWDLL